MGRNWVIKQADGAKMTGGNVRREAFVEAATAAELLETLGQMRATVRPLGYGQRKSDVEK